MSLPSKFKDDPLLNRVLRSSAHLFTSNTLSLGLSVVMSALSFRLLGASGSGLIALVMSYTSTVNSLFSFRMSELVVRYGGEFLEKGEKEKASALIKSAALAEAVVSVLAFLVVLISSMWASQTFTKSPDSKLMFIVFALGLLANFNTETSTGILQVTGKIRHQGTINLIQSIISLGIVITAFFLPNPLWIVLLAYLASKVIPGLGLYFMGRRQLQNELGVQWQNAPMMNIAESRSLIRFAISSNISATIIKIFRESESLWIGLFLSTEAVGYYKAAYSLVGFLSVPADPLIAATYPEINRLIVQRAWTSLRSFLRKITALAFAINAAAALGFIFLGQFALVIFTGRQEFVAAYPAMIALCIGLAFNYTLFWNRPLLLSLGLTDYPIWTTLIVGLAKLALAFWLVPQYGILAAGALLSFYYIASVGIMAWRGVKEIQ
ncbi:oligosaccharide flippase family protein [Candidatus Villigracilis saccharophilus]|uniref:oligosaccharide flippase family protein n=1 Tax=Candidatus Villigracilis saccharophilus TaxID=3140684 RepID=UPI0031373A15|nr:oligosaccharide flippase family protein [Anaerolineales bacterium]